MPSFTVLFAGVVALAKASVAFKEMIEGFIQFYIEKKLEGINNKFITKDQKFDLVMKKITEAKTNEERLILSKLLADIERM